MNPQQFTPIKGSLAKCRITVSWGENRPAEQTQTQPKVKP